ncbi:small ribosomal subunit biogenesis GTPase RsgA [Nitrincola iocasae]|uniref:Small ribosomal subunit biogenesis GTPase RsgA n=1 Tax=Nitrincola iocasae TaxID=2614693 RepID=A0A5J6LGJ2_9GAMM|nr:small ribosomal subunit biogenesis GTPase RsgA [Nitrincola iocasae]QEW07634.1 small ribosomal subunit biogenesis GTPase RsgA [Nitrincola iocasae]
MSKRKVTRRQSWRISKIQQERTDRANRKETQIEEQLSGGELGTEQNGLIISHFGKQVDVEALEGDTQGAIVRCHLRTHLGQLVTGDRVIWRRSPDGGVVVAVLPRHNQLQRPNNHGELKPVAANIDQIVITLAPEPRAHANLIDRYLIACERSEIEPVLLLNKTDLITPENKVWLDPMLALYRQIGYRILEASTTEQSGLTELKALLNGRISVFVGQSGVGKSSLINALLPGIDLKVGGLSEQSGKGKHTTTTARLFHMPDGGDLIDSPGIREFGLWHMHEDEVLEGFIEFRPFIGHCRFRDCKHLQEPGCALMGAVDKGEISEQRFKSYRMILNSMQETL